MDAKGDKLAVIADSDSNGRQEIDESAVEGENRDFATNGNLIDDGLQRGLKSRHLQMIALGGVVGYEIL
jgi:amino acid transporter